MGVDTASAAASPCERDGCGRSVDRSPTGRPRRFCSAACRRTAHRQRALAEIRAASREDLVWAAELGARLAAKTWADMLAALADRHVGADTIRAVAATVADRAVDQATTVAAFFPPLPKPVSQITAATGDTSNGDTTVATVATRDNDPATANDDPDWAWATSPDCPTTWWQQMGREPTDAERTWLHVEAADPALAGQLDDVLNAVTARQQALGVQRAKRMTHRDRRAVHRMLTAGRHPVGDVTSALVWAVEHPFWGVKYLADRGIPDRPGTTKKLLEQWRAAGSPTPDSDGTLAAAATRLCSVWADLIGVDQALPGWTGRALEALRGSATNPALPEAEVAELMRWMRQPENARYTGGDEFPYLSALVKARGRRRGNGTGGKALPDRTAGAVSEPAVASGW